jgi:hypothetical protein
LNRGLFKIFLVLYLKIQKICHNDFRNFQLQYDFFEKKNGLLFAICYSLFAIKNKSIMVYQFKINCLLFIVSLLVSIQTWATDASQISNTQNAPVKVLLDMGNLSQTLPETKRKFTKARYADDIIIEKLNATPGQIMLITVGPLTNLAAAENKSPGILAKAKEVIIMGGTFLHKGNITSHAEFNIYSNPKAAQTVFASRNDIVVLPLDVTHNLRNEDLITSKFVAKPVRFQLSHLISFSFLSHFGLKI